MTSDNHYLRMQEIPNLLLIEKIDNIISQVTGWDIRVRKVQELLKGIVDILGNQVPGMDYLEAEAKVKQELNFLDHKIKELLREKQNLYMILIHNQSDQGLT